MYIIWLCVGTYFLYCLVVVSAPPSFSPNLTEHVTLFAKKTHKKNVSTVFRIKFGGQSNHLIHHMYVHVHISIDNEALTCTELATHWSIGWFFPTKSSTCTCTHIVVTSTCYSCSNNYAYKHWVQSSPQLDSYRLRFPLLWFLIARRWQWW